MASMRTLRRRLLRWHRYAAKTCWRASRPRGYDRDAVRPDGHLRAYEAVQELVERRFWDETPEIWLGGPEGEASLIRDVLGGCDVCGLPDLHRGNGDGIGSCDCPRCDCGVARSSSFCTCDPACSYCLSKACEGDCDEAFADEPDDDAGHGDDWPRAVVSLPDISEWRLP